MGEEPGRASPHFFDMPDRTVCCRLLSPTIGLWMTSLQRFIKSECPSDFRSSEDSGGSQLRTPFKPKIHNFVDHILKGGIHPRFNPLTENSRSNSSKV